MELFVTENSELLIFLQIVFLGIDMVQFIVRLYRMHVSSPCYSVFIFSELVSYIMNMFLEKTCLPSSLIEKL